MGIHTSIFRERYLCAGDHKKYRIKLFKGTEEIKLENPVSLREEFILVKALGLSMSGSIGMQKRKMENT